MLPDLNFNAKRFPIFWSLALALAVMSMAFVSCSDSPSGPDDGQESKNSETDIIHGNFLGAAAAFEFVSSNGDGDYAVRGRNIAFDSMASAITVDLSIVNLGDHSLPLPVTLTFMSLEPEGVTVQNPDNDQNGAGAMIMFEFSDSTGEWAPGMESMPRSTMFGVTEVGSIAFVSRIDAGSSGNGELGAIGGMAWNDADGDGLLGESESGLVNVTVELDAENMETKSATTDDDGMYLFDNLDVGLYQVSKKPGDGEVPTTPTAIQVILVDNEGSVDPFLAANFGCMANDSGGGETASIGGMVFNDANENGMLDEGEPGIEGVTVGLEGDGKSTSMKTGFDGLYQFDELIAGLYTVTKTTMEGSMPTTPASVEVILADVGNGLEDVLDIHFGCAMSDSGGMTASIGGMVYDDANGDGIHDEGETGLEGVTVGVEGGGKSISMKTDTGGMYLFNELAAATYTVTKVAMEGWTATTPASVEVKLSDTGSGLEDMLDVDFGCMADDSGGGETASIGGMVFNDANGDGVQDEGEAGLEGVTVGLEGGGKSISMKTGFDSRYQFDDLSAETYTVTKVPLEGWTATTPASVEVKLADTGSGLEDVLDVNFGCMQGSLESASSPNSYQK